MTRLSLALVALVSAAASASAQAPAPVEGRYRMQAVEGGIARLDTATGEISFCRVERAAIACERSADAGAESRLDALAARVERLEAGAARSERSSPAEEMEAAADGMRFFFRTFRDIIREMDEELDGAEPDRTSIRG